MSPSYRDNINNVFPPFFSHVRALARISHIAIDVAYSFSSIIRHPHDRSYRNTPPTSRGQATETWFFKVSNRHKTKGHIGLVSSNF